MSSVKPSYIPNGGTIAMLAEVPADLADPATTLHAPVSSLAEAFPDVPPDALPLGGRVLIQLRRLNDRTKGGIHLVQDTRDTAKWNNQVGKVIAMGSLAFKNRETCEPWKEGAWCQVGDYVRIPRWDGDRFDIPVKGSGIPVEFVIMNDHQIIAKIVGDPLEQRVYVL